MAQATAEIFSVEHYDTAGHFGFSHFSDAWGEATAELGLTIQALKNAHGQLPAFRREDLVGYHFLHYGADNEVTEEVLGPGSFDADWAQPLNDALPAIISNPRTVQPIDLGRITLGTDTEVDDQLTRYWMEQSEVTGDGTPGNRMGAKRFGEFLYPREGAIVRYLGRSSIDMMKEHPKGYVQSDGGLGGIVLDRLAFHVDTFSVGDDHQIEVYNALSYDENSHCRLTKIAKAEGLVSFQPAASL
jgi:hypothetical protein